MHTEHIYIYILNSYTNDLYKKLSQTYIRVASVESAV